MFVSNYLTFIYIYAETNVNMPNKYNIACNTLAMKFTAGLLAMKKTVQHMTEGTILKRRVWVTL